MDRHLTGDDSLVGHVVANGRIKFLLCTHKGAIGNQAVDPRRRSRDDVRCELLLHPQHYGALVLGLQVQNDQQARATEVDQLHAINPALRDHRAIDDGQVSRQRAEDP